MTPGSWELNDQGREMACHAAFSKATGMTVYFAHPHSPWERGRNDNTNGLLWQYLPKGSDLGVYSQERFYSIAWSLNVRPRKSLDWKCPAELFPPEGHFDFNALCFARKLMVVRNVPFRQIARYSHFLIHYWLS